MTAEHLFGEERTMGERIVAQGTPVFDDYAAAVAATVRRPSARTLVFVAAMFVVVFVFLGLLKGALALVPVGMLCVVVVFLVPFLRAAQRKTVRRGWESHPAARTAMRMQIDNDGVRIADDEGNLRLTKWDKYIGWKETGLVFVLHLAPNLVNFVPKRFLSEGDVARLRSLLQLKVTGQKGSS